ncbi:MAG: hypothetical protein SRB1_02027 [Desulfobacteraceae bacterium Eth-SRB1]|nr:MAG: hypothetical protein SRB1_02027 [Desulfobacteraceae bacterium Eth-SRB1]
MSLTSKSFSILQRDIFLFLCRMISGVVIARKLGPELLGLWAILQLIPGYAEAFGRFKFDIAAVYFLGQKKTTLGEMVFTLNLLALITGVLIVSVFVWQFEWFYSYLFKNSPVNMRLLAYYTLAIIPLSFLLTNYNYLIIFLEDIKTYNKMIVLSALLSSGFGIFLLLVFDLGIFAMLTGSILGVTTSLCYGAIKIARVEKMKPNWNPHLMKKMTMYCFYSYIGGIIGHLNGYITNLLVALFLSPAQVAFYSMAKNRSQIVSKIPNALSTLLFPKISKSTNKEESSHLAARAFRVTFIMLFFMGIILAILIKPWVYILYGKAFLPMTTPFWIILPGIVFFQSTTVIGQYFSGVGRADLGPKINFFPMIIQAILAYYLIQNLNVIGASIAFSVSSLLFGLIQIGVFIRISTCTMTDLLITKDDYNTVTKFILSQVVKFTSRLSTLYHGKISRRKNEI